MLFQEIIETSLFILVLKKYLQNENYPFLLVMPINNINLYMHFSMILQLISVICATEIYIYLEIMHFQYNYIFGNIVKLDRKYVKRIV